MSHREEDGTRSRWLAGFFFARLSFQAVLTVLTPTVTHWTCSVCTCVLTGMDLNTVEFLYRLRQTHNFVQMTCSFFFFKKTLKTVPWLSVVLASTVISASFFGFCTLMSKLSNPLNKVKLKHPPEAECLFTATLQHRTGILTRLFSCRYALSAFRSPNVPLLSDSYVPLKARVWGGG